MIRRWRCRDLSTLIWREWDDGVVLYDSLSGHTHRLDALSFTALELLAEEPRDLDGLLAALRAMLDQPADDLAGALNPVLHDMHRARLIEPAE